MTALPKFGPFGTVGPAPRFTWGEFRCRDGYLPSLPGLRHNIALLARLLNALRIAVAAVYGVHPSRVFIVVNSAVRSPSYNASLPGAAADSYHTPRRHTWRKAGTRAVYRWAGRTWARRYWTAKGCCAADVQVFVKRRDGRTVKVAPRSVRNIAVAKVPGFRNGGRGVYLTFTHVDHRGYPADWNG